MTYKPPYKITDEIVSLVADISLLLGQYSATLDLKLSPQLRKGNRLRTIQASLAIENNTLNLEQVTAVLEGKRILGLPREIQEVRNAFNAYENLPFWRANNADDLLNAHALMMFGLVDNPGNYREGSVGVYKDEKLIHIAPPASRVQLLINDLLNWLKTTNCHPLIASCVFHYEFEYIHPFNDGNGRIGRLWQTLYLSHWQAIFEYIPVETVIKSQQTGYYQALALSDEKSESTPFIAFMLSALLSAIEEVNESVNKKNDQVTDQASDQVKALLNWLNNKCPQSLSDILVGLSLRHRPTFKKNYLLPALSQKWVALTAPNSPKSPQQKYYITALGKKFISGIKNDY